MKTTFFAFSRIEPWPFRIRLPVGTIEDFPSDRSPTMGPTRDGTDVPSALFQHRPFPHRRITRLAATDGGSRGVTAKVTIRPSPFRNAFP